AARPPQAFVPATVAITEAEPDFETARDDLAPVRLPRGMGWLGRVAWGAGGLLVSLGLGLMADRLIGDLFARYAWLGWAGIALLAAFLLALVILLAREILALRRLRTHAVAVLVSDRRDAGRHIEASLARLYADRPDLARARETLAQHAPDMFD